MLKEDITVYLETIPIWYKGREYLWDIEADGDVTYDTVAGDCEGGGYSELDADIKAITYIGCMNSVSGIEYDIDTDWYPHLPKEVRSQIEDYVKDQMICDAREI